MKIPDSYVARRRFLCGMIGGGAASLGTGLAVPLVAYVGNLRAEPPPRFVEVAPADCDLAPGASKMMMYGPLPMLLLHPREAPGTLRIFVATCTHLNCTVGYQAEKNRIRCACHDGAFDTLGRVLSGPPPDPLWQFHTRWINGKLRIALEKADLETAS
jgi:Rieske Fe-S protein